METKEQMLSRVLGDLGLNELPTPSSLDGVGRVWTKAIALVLKKSGSETYALLKRDERFNEFIVKDYGEESAILAIKEIYPYEFLKYQFIQGFKNNDLEQRRDYLKFLNLPFIHNIDSLSLDELNKEIVCAAIYLQDLDFKGIGRNDEVQEYRNKYIVKNDKDWDDPTENTIEVKKRGRKPNIEKEN